MTIPRITNVEATSRNDDQRMKDLEARVAELEIENQKNVSPEVRRILDEIKAINPSVYSENNISLIIDGIPESERR